MSESRHLLSWNVNGIRAIHRKNLLAPLLAGGWDIIALQETKSQDLSAEFTQRLGYQSFWSSAERKGYSGTALYIKDELLADMGVEIFVLKDFEAGNEFAKFDAEGRTLIADFGSFVLLNCYFPNAQEGGKRLDYKLDFNRAVHYCCDKLSQGHLRPVLLCGDYNVAVSEIDLARPEDNHTSPGFLPQERAWMKHFLASGYSDSFRHFYPKQTGAYSWWSYRTRARPRNIGWRIDYFCINNSFVDRLESAAILDQTMGSDHCPVSITVKL